ncbi:MAG: EAL domain-containing protein [Burkholderiales bacterium]|nr:EAL domain-containing protein [Burkholderiales bacterium]
MALLAGAGTLSAGVLWLIHRDVVPAESAVVVLLVVVVGLTVSLVRLRGRYVVASAATQLARDASRHRDFYAALSHTNRAILHSTTREALFEAVCGAAVDYGHIRLAWIGTLDETGLWIESRTARGGAGDDYPRIRVSVDPSNPESAGFAAAAIHQGRCQIVNDILAEPRLTRWHQDARMVGVRSMAVFPLREGDRAIGILTLHGHEAGFFTDALTGLLWEMADAVSYGLTNLRHAAAQASARQALADSDEKFRQLTTTIPGVFWTAGADGRVNYVSARYASLVGRSPERLVRDWRDWLRAVHRDDRLQVLQQIRAATDGIVDHEFRVVVDGAVRWIRNRSFAVTGAGGRLMLITGMAEEITERKQNEEQLERMARYDQLTGLSNRALFYDRLQHTIVRVRRSDRVAALVFLDLDHFKRINDTLGHAIGDRVLQEVATRLQKRLRAGDTVARLSGDEFAVILADLATADDAATVGRALLDDLDKAFLCEGHELFPSASAGITVIPADGDTPEVLLKNADTAMYRAKEAGRNTFRFFEPVMHARALERMSMEGQLRRALDRDEFLLHYQPKVDLISGAVVGMEALLRWRHPERGLVSPVDFIPLLEDNGLIVPVGEWVLGQACRQAMAWRQEDLLPEGGISVNVSGRQLQEPDAAHRLVQVVADSGVDPRLIELEITETVLMRNADHTEGILQALKDVGLRLSIDDFGTGYSSLAYLKRFPLDALKIDRSFVRDITTDAEDALITRAIISIAKSLRLASVAEGVETDAQRAFLAAAGCDVMQGYLFSRPLTTEDCTAMLAAGRGLGRAERDTAGAHTLLVVDDDVSILSLVQRTLRHEGYRILTTADPGQVLELMATHEVGVILADHRMPGTSGVELLRRVRSLYPDTVRLIMSGSADGTAATEAINQGEVYKFILKPWDNTELRSALRDAFSHRALRDENLTLKGRLQQLEATIAGPRPLEQARLSDAL